MTENQLPENIKQAVDLISAVIQRIKKNKLAINNKSCLYMTNTKGVKHGK